MSQRELGQAIGLSPNAAGARMQRLIDKRVITGFTTVVNHAALGRTIEAIIDVWLNEERDSEALQSIVETDERIVECLHPTGPLDFIIRAHVESTDDLFALLSRLREDGGVRQTDSRLILERMWPAPK